MRCHLIRFHKMVKGSPTPQGCTHKLPRKSLPGSWGTFSRVGKPCSVSEGHFPGWEKLARFQGNVFPGGKSLPGSWGTFSLVGKACLARGERFPEWEKLARFQGNVFPGGKSLLGFRGTFSRALKPCCVLRQHFYEHGNLAAFCSRLSTIICSLQSFPIRSHQGVCDTPLQLAANNIIKQCYPSQ